MKKNHFKQQRTAPVYPAWTGATAFLLPLYCVSWHSS